MEDNVEPAPYRIVGRIFPGLQSVAMAQVVRRFPVVECLVAILYGCVKCCEDIGTEEDVESANWFDSERSRRSEAVRVHYRKYKRALTSSSFPGPVCPAAY